MHKGLTQIINTINTFHMILPDEHVIAGVSGGADSMCLLLVLQEWQKCYGGQLTVVHVEHGIRGVDSCQDAEFVKQICKDWEIPCVIRHIDAKKLAEESRQTLEEAARKARYQIFEEVRRETGGDKIAVAHNQNDQAETVLMNLVRGCGVKGMGGILPVRDRIIRPLLFTTRKEIEAYLQERNITWCTDMTNLETDYTRNKIRLEVLPLLSEGVNAQTVAHIAETAARFQRTEQYLQRQGENAFRQCVLWPEMQSQQSGAGRPEGLTGQEAVVQSEDLFGQEAAGRSKSMSISIRTEVFKKQEELMQEYVLRHCVACLYGEVGLKDFAAVHVEQLKELAGKPCGKSLNLPHGLRAVRQRDVLKLICDGKQLAAGLPGKENGKVTDRQVGKETDEATGKSFENQSQSVDQSCCVLSTDGSYRFHNRTFQVNYLEEILSFPEKKYTKWLAYDTIKRNLCLRTRRSGDYLIINQKGGRKKLKDYLIDQKVPREERDQVVVLAEDSHVLWVVGFRISEGAKVTEQTKKIIKIQVMEEMI